MSADAGFLIFLALIAIGVCYATARANRIKLQRETNARLAAMQAQLDAIGDAVGARAAEAPIERVLIAEPVSVRSR